MTFISTLLIGFLFVCLAGSSTPLAYTGGKQDNALYSFAYHVLDPSVGQDFGHAEQGLQEAVKGEYKVLMPDDRVQVVTYTADHNGYVANVHYTDGSQSPAYGKQKSNQPATVSTFFNPPAGTPGYGGASNYYGGSSYGGMHYANGYPSSYASHGGGSFLTNYAQSRMGAYVPGVGCTCP